MYILLFRFVKLVFWHNIKTEHTICYFITVS